jgi:hypothetical protein
MRHPNSYEFKITGAGREAGKKKRQDKESAGNKVPELSCD